MVNICKYHSLQWHQTSRTCVSSYPTNPKWSNCPSLDQAAFTAVPVTPLSYTCHHKGYLLIWTCFTFVSVRVCFSFCSSPQLAREVLVQVLRPIIHTILLALAVVMTSCVCVTATTGLVFSLTRISILLNILPLTFIQ